MWCGEAWRVMCGWLTLYLSSSLNRVVGGSATNESNRRLSSLSGLSSLAKPADNNERANLWCLCTAGLSRCCSASLRRTIGAS